MADESPARITRVKLKNYKSIVSCDVELRPLTILVGPNGSGKSNFVDALRFVSEALTVGLDQAIRNRGNIFHILSEASWPGTATFSVELDFELGMDISGRYGLAIGAIDENGEFTVRQEELVLNDGIQPTGATLFSVNDDGLMSVQWPSRGDDDERSDHRPASDIVDLWLPDSLFLATYSRGSEARPVFDLLRSMAFYNPAPSVMGIPREHEPGIRLSPDGANVASVLRRIEATKPETFWRINQYLSRVLPGLETVAGRDLGGYDSLEFRQRLAGRDDPCTFTPRQMSDGTLRALGVLVALFQGRMGGKSLTSMVGIEEPEAGLHPAVGDALFNALVDASYTTQVLVTTHSADLLQSSDLDTDSLLAVVAEDGVTRIGPIDDVGRSVLRDRLFTAGELLQMEQLRPVTQGNGSDGDVSVAAPNSAE
jgi:predicted ATPase